ncbi:MAG TPA: CDC48 family AAA ATPase [Candidatus Paceibacterota bacterium]|nr:CDC48 family AAA ATPase [Candidatus Paceibacterota bacterium]
MTNKENKFRVAEASQDDAYKGIARVDYETMKSLGLKRGDVVIIKGGKETVAIIERAYPADVGEGIIRIDGIIRKNAKTSVGELVKIEKADVKEAKKITIAPVQENIVIHGDPEIFRRGLLGRAIIKGDIVVLGGAQRRKDILSTEFGDINDIFGEMFNNMAGINGMGLGGLQQIRFMVVNSNPTKPVVITENTEIVVNPKAIPLSEEKVIDVTYEDIGGLKEEIKKIREMIELPLKHPEIFERLGIEPPKGVLLYGPPGTGKTLLAKAVANESEANFILLNGPEVMSKFYGESEKRIRDIFNEAEKSAPAIIFIDEIDAIAPKREDVQGEVERRVVSQLLTMMDGLKTRGRVVVIGATNRPNSIDPALRRPGRFDREVEINAPDKDGRLSILKIHTRNMPITKDVKLEELAGRTHGFVGADLSSLAKEAAMSVLRRVLPDMDLKEDEEISKEVLEKLKVSDKDFQEALKVVRPSAMREVLVETPTIGWNDVGGLEKIKQELKEAVEWPIIYPDSFKRMGIRPPRGILLYGPPGTGKTLLAKAIAKESEANFIQIKGPSLLSMWVGKSEEGVRKIFERARQVAPCIIFFDEIDSLASRRGMDTGTKVTERVLNQILSEMDGLEELHDITVIGATNRPDMLDPALLRPGRFDRILLIQAPTKEGRLQVLKIHTKNMPLGKDVKIEELAEKTEGFVGADIENLTREAAILALREDINTKQVLKKHFDEAMKKVRPSVTKQDMETYNKIEETYLKSAKAALANKTAYLG